MAFFFCDGIGDNYRCLEKNAENIISISKHLSIDITDQKLRFARRHLWQSLQDIGMKGRQFSKPHFLNLRGAKKKSNNKITANCASHAKIYF